MSLTSLRPAPAEGAPPVLTGRWGDTRLPQQLLSTYPTKKTQALVVVTFSTICPLAKRLVPTLNQLQAQYFDQDIQFIALFPNGMDDLSAMAAYAVETNLAFPIFQDDPQSPWHEALGLTTTPGVVVLDTRDGWDAAQVVYRGQINGQWFGGGANNQKQNYLADALARFVNNEPIALSETAASGCAIARDAPRDTQQFAHATYYQDILPLLQRSCQSCHREGEPGAELFADFDSYETVASMAPVMLSRIENRLMPPWHAHSDPNHPTGGFQGDLRLSEDEILLFRTWVERDCPAGDAHSAPPASVWPDPEAWQIGTPDFIFSMPEPYIVPRDRLDEYQFYRVEANFPEDRYIQAIEMRPGNKAVVHHMGAIVGKSSTEPMTANQALLKLYGLTGDKIKKIGDYIPGDPFNARTYPAGHALKLPAGHDLFFEMHYTPTGAEEEADLSRLGIVWAKQKPEHVIDTQVFNRKDLRLKPHTLHYEKTSYYQYATDVLIYALAPHMHYRGKDFSLYQVEHLGTPEEKRTLVLRIPTYDFNWQRTYEFVKPLRLRAGDALMSVAHFDNSHYNPNNLDPEAMVRFGLLSDKEMLNMRSKFEQVDFDTELLNAESLDTEPSGAGP
jgi:thiol-disulfide isomerase/thioredoxin